MRKGILAAAAAVLAWGAAETASAQQLNDGSQQPLTGSYQLQQPMTGSYQLQQPLTGSYQLEQPLTGSYQLQQPMTGSYQLQQPFTGSYQLQQPSTSSYGLDFSFLGNSSQSQSMSNYVLQPPTSSFGSVPTSPGVSPYQQQSVGSPGFQQTVPGTSSTQVPGQ
ncbi:hypothetical protein [Hyalangium gracile]|uniref:hypothetical protein n=1 Tax=Hyalangium gracile TaxID=394092 RepID=UPI001CCFDBE8|nr:hypothetical protein [Hyalangium gracile]